MKARADVGWRVVKNESIRFQEGKKGERGRVRKKKKHTAARVVESQDGKRD